MKDRKGNPENRHYDGLLGYITPESDEELLHECEVQYYKGKTSSTKMERGGENAVRLHHKPTDIRVSSNLAINQHANREVALDKLREKITKMLRFSGPRVETVIPEEEKKERIREKKLHKQKINDRKNTDLLE